MRAKPYFVLLAAMAMACEGRPRIAPDDSDDEAESAPNAENGGGALLEFDLTRGAPESTSAGSFIPLPATRTYSGLVRAVERAREDEDARGALVRFGEASFDWAHAEELGQLFGDWRRKSKKPVYCHVIGMNNPGTWLTAEACDEVWVAPAGGVDSVGIAGQVVYLKSALEHLGIRADFVHLGRFKSAAETFTQDGPSEEARENLNTVLRAIRRQWLDGTTQARNKPNVKQALEDGPWSAPAAVKRGLADAVGFETETRDALEKKAGAGRVESAYGPREHSKSGIDFADIVRMIAGVDTRLDKPHLAVVPAIGSIAMQGGGLMSDGGITAKAYTKIFRKLRKDDAVKAVVLRIDSPGGSALASDLLWHELMELKKKKPLVASVGGMAASGGYYMACAANKIVAPATSIVGSIGVFGGKIVLSGSLDKVGVRVMTFPASDAEGAAARAAYLSPLEPWDDATRARVREQMQGVYDLFISRVSEGRGKPAPDIRKIAEGRIYTGGQGLDIGLVDEIGGLSHALAVARQLAALESDAPVTVVGPQETLLDLLRVGEGASASEVEAAVLRLAASHDALLGRLQPSIRPFVASLAPLAAGEVAVAALPYALSIQ